MCEIRFVSVESRGSAATDQAKPRTATIGLKCGLFRTGEKRRRRRHHDPYDSRTPRSKRTRHDCHEAYFKELGRDRASLDRYFSRRDMINGGYSDYMRDYHHQRPPLPPLPFSAPQSYGLETSPYYERPLHPDFISPRQRPMDKRAYERSVDDFLRRTARPPNRPDRRYRDRL